MFWQPGGLFTFRENEFSHFKSTYMRSVYKYICDYNNKYNDQHDLINILVQLK